MPSELVQPVNLLTCVSDFPVSSLDCDTNQQSQSLLGVSSAVLNKWRHCTLNQTARFLSYHSSSLFATIQSLDDMQSEA